MSSFEFAISVGAVLIALGLALVVHGRQKQWPRNTHRHFGWTREAIKRDSVHFIRKFAGTLRIVAVLTLARTFGRYETSVSGDGFNYARYRWRGKTWAFPTTPIEQE